MCGPYHLHEPCGKSGALTPRAIHFSAKFVEQCLFYWSCRLLGVGGRASPVVG